MEELKFIREHHCKTVDSSNCVAIEKHRNCGEERWYLNLMSSKKSSGELHGIMYCPYCGKELE